MTTVYKNLAEIIAYDDSREYKGVPQLKLKFKRLNSTTPDKECNYSVEGQGVDTIKPELLDKIYGLSVGEKVCVHVGKDDAGWPLVLDISDAKDATDGKKAYGASQYKGGGKPFTPRDDSGIAVGAAWNNAIEILKAGLTIEDVSAMADAVLKIKLEQEKRLKAVNQSKTDVGEKEEAKAVDLRAQAKARAEAAKAKKSPPVKDDELIDKDLDEVDFGEEV